MKSKKDGGLSDIFRKRLPKFDWQRVESPLTGSGTPDVNYCFEGVEGWIEFKGTTTNRAKVRPEQIGWAERRARHGGLVFIAIRQRKGNHDLLWLSSSSGFREVKLLPLHEIEHILAWEGGPSEWPWDRISLILSSQAKIGVLTP